MDSVGNYINKSKSNLSNIIKHLEFNIEYLDNTLWETLDNAFVDDIVNIYYDRYFLNIDKNFDKISMYIDYNNKINYKLKSILLAIIDYYEFNDKVDIIEKNEGSILYFTILVYIALQIYDTSFLLIDDSKKIEKFINNIIDNFAKIRFKKDRDLNKLIYAIKDNILYNNYFNKTINNLSSSNNNNLFIRVNKDVDLYKVIYNFKIKDLIDFDSRDVNVVNNNLKIPYELNKISFDLCYFTLFKLLKDGKNITMLFPINKDIFIENFDYYFCNRNKEILKYIKFIVEYEELMNDYNFINKIREENIDLYINVEKSFVTNNYNMFMNVNNVVISEDFLTINEKYLEIWKDMNLNFIVRNMDNKLTEKDLIKESKR